MCEYPVNHILPYRYRHVRQKPAMLAGSLKFLPLNVCWVLNSQTSQKISTVSYIKGACVPTHRHTQFKSSENGFINPNENKFTLLCPWRAAASLTKRNAGARKPQLYAHAISY